MQEIPGIRFRHRGIYLETTDTVVLSDLHLGRGYRAGIDAPFESADDIEFRLDELLTEFSPQNVVLAGDVLDAFTTVPYGIEARLRGLIERIEQAGSRTIFLEGNHDPMLETLLDIPVSKTHECGDTLIAHGHTDLPPGYSRYVVGHVHPAIRIEGVKRPCYLNGPAPTSGKVIVLPAFARSARGTVMNRRLVSETESPFLSNVTLDDFRPVIRDERTDETFIFPVFSSLRPFL